MPSLAMERQDNRAVGAQGLTPAKFSRYRSVRKAASNNAHEIHPINTSVPPVPNFQSASAPVSRDGSDWTSSASTTVKKSMSRYRRQKPPSSTLSPDPPPYPPPLPTSQGQSPVSSAQPDLSDKEYEERERDRQDAMDRLTGGCAKSTASSSTHRRPTTQGRAATDRDVRRAGEKQGAQERGDAASRLHPNHEPKRRSFRDAIKFTRSKDKPTNGPSVSSPVESSGAAHFPGIDAPISAVNAGERRVLVQYKKHSLKISVTPSTSAKDILESASGCLSSEIDPLRFILMESFTSSGLERPLRQYEYAREIMNSWAHDGENALIIVPAASTDALAVLDGQNVSMAQPTDATFHMYYSQRPRKWDKRYVTLRPDGQITVSKKEGSKEQVNACHLSDFDIYSPTPPFLSRTVKPPKKICYAIKSQQKSSMFLSTENFIHFFATNDRSVAEGWYKAVQAWRSWYLMNKLGAGLADGSSEAEAGAIRPPDDSAQTRTFKPLLSSVDYYSSEDKESPTEAAVDRSKTQQMFARKRTSRDHGPPPSSFPKSLAGETETPTGSNTDGSPFASAGLLGRTYTLRQRAMKDREEREKRETEELFNQGLVGAASSRRQLHSGPASRSNTMTSAQAPETDSLVKRSLSINRGKPLVDLTPVYQEPPQHIRKGKGVTVDPGMPLIDAATGNEAPGGIAIPPAKTWRRPPVPPEPQSNPEMRTRTRSNTIRSNSSRNRHQNSNPSSPTSPIDAGQAFVPNSLLARTGHAPPVQGVPIGHGVATGDRNATKPMLDISPQSPFAEGSLLRGL